MADSFWSTADARHQRIARKFYEGIEIAHPSSVSSDRYCPYCHHCIWHTTSVKYYKYNGPRPSRL